MVRRIKWLDLAKGITILFVLLIHALSFHFFFLYLLDYLLCIFAMPCFFAMSGYLYKPVKSLHEYLILIYKKITSIIIPYVVFSFVLRCLHNIHYNTKPYFLVHLDDFIYPKKYLWFLYALFFIFVIVGLIDLLHVNIYIQGLLYLIFTLLQFKSSWIIHNGNINPLVCIFGYIFCFYIGYIVKILVNSKLNYYMHDDFLLLLLIIIYVVLNVIVINVNSINTIDIITPKDIVIKIFSIFVFFDIFINLKQNNMFNYFIKYGKYTLIIYLVHFPILNVFKIIFNHISINNLFINQILLILLVWYLSTFICYLSNRFKIIYFIFYPRKYINKLVLKTKWGRYLLD